MQTMPTTTTTIIPLITFIRRVNSPDLLVSAKEKGQTFGDLVAAVGQNVLLPKMR
jgi:hypothetical protein